MKRLLLIVALVNCGINTSHAMEEPIKVTLPSADVLKERLDENGFDYLCENTNLCTDLGGRTLNAIGVATKVGCILADYNKSLGSVRSTMSKVMGARKAELVETILQDHPEAIKQLKELGLIE